MKQIFKDFEREPVFKRELRPDKQQTRAVTGQTLEEFDHDALELGSWSKRA